MHHRTLPGEPHFWLGCYSGPSGLGGIDSELDGKVNTPPIGSSACQSAQATDCVDGFAGSLYDQDECYGDANDHGVSGPVGFETAPCSPISAIDFNLASCQPTNGFLNICIDWNGDGDWNDILVRPCGCVYEWPVKNVPITIPAGCSYAFSPGFLVPDGVGEVWMRISVTQDPVPDDYPWNGSAGAPGGVFAGGETEDYIVTFGSVPTRSQSWGGVKAHYR